MKNSKVYTAADVEIINIAFNFSSACEIDPHPCVFNSARTVTPQIVKTPSRPNGEPFPDYTSITVYSLVDSCLAETVLQIGIAFTPSSLAEYFRNPENVEKLIPKVVEDLNK